MIQNRLHLEDTADVNNAACVCFGRRYILEFSVHVKAEDCVIVIDTVQYWAAKNMSSILYCETQNLHINSVGLISTQQDQLHTISSTLT